MTVTTLSEHFGTNPKVATGNEIEAKWKLAAAAYKTFEMDLPFENTGTPTGGLTEQFNTGSDLYAVKNLHARWSLGAFSQQKGQSFNGTFVGVDPGVENVLLENPQIDGKLAYGDTGTISAVTLTIEEVISATQLKFTSSSVSGLKTTTPIASGLVEDLTGLNAGLRNIASWNATDRILTLKSPGLTGVQAGNRVRVGWNDNAISAGGGVTDLAIRGGVLQNFPAITSVPMGGGSKGINFEQGVYNGVIEDVTIKNCGTAIFLQAYDGGLPLTRGDREIYGARVSNIFVRDCGSLLTLSKSDGYNAEGNANVSLMHVDGVVYENCGHNPHRVVRSDFQKAGVINLLSAENVYVRNVTGRNGADYPAAGLYYPAVSSPLAVTDEPHVGSGLSGPIGAVIWGNGRNLTFENIVHHGDVDHLVRIGRARALGDDAAFGQWKEYYDSTDATRIAFYSTGTAPDGLSFYDPTSSTTKAATTYYVRKHPTKPNVVGVAASSTGPVINFTGNGFGTMYYVVTDDPATLPATIPTGHSLTAQFNHSLDEVVLLTGTQPLTVHPVYDQVSTTTPYDAVKLTPIGSGVAPDGVTFGQTYYVLRGAKMNTFILRQNGDGTGTVTPSAPSSGTLARINLQFLNKNMAVEIAPDYSQGLFTLGMGIGAVGKVRYCHNWNIRSLHHQGTVHKYVVGADAISKPISPELDGRWTDIVVDKLAPGAALISPELATYDGLYLELVEKDTGKVVRGTPAQIYAGGNLFSAFPDQINDLVADLSHTFTVTLAANEMVELTPRKTSGKLHFTIGEESSTAHTTSGTTLHRFTAPNSAGYCELLTVSPGVAVKSPASSTTMVTGSTAGTPAETSNKLYFRTTSDGKVQMKNRFTYTCSWLCRWE